MSEDYYDYWERQQAERDEAEYQRGVAEGERYINDKKMFGEELAEAFRMQDELNAYNNGTDE